MISSIYVTNSVLLNATKSSVKTSVCIWWAQFMSQMGVFQSDMGHQVWPSISYLKFYTTHISLLAAAVRCNAMISLLNI